MTQSPKEPNSNLKEVSPTDYGNEHAIIERMHQLQVEEKIMEFGGKDDTEITYKIKADTWNPDKPEVIYPEQQSNGGDK